LLTITLLQPRRFVGLSLHFQFKVRDFLSGGRFGGRVCDGNRGKVMLNG